MSLINLQTAVDARREGGFFRQLSVSSSLSQLWLHAHAFERPKRRWSWLWQGCSQQWWTVNVPLQKQWFLFPDVSCTPIICWTTLLPSSSKDAQSPWVCSLSQELWLLRIIARVELRDALYIQGICWRSQICCVLAPTAGVRSCVGVLVDYGFLNLKVLVAPVLLLLQLGQIVLRAHDWRRGRRRWRLGVRVLVWLFDWTRRRRAGGGLVSKTTLKTSVVPSRFCKSTTLLIAQVSWTPPA